MNLFSKSTLACCAAGLALTALSGCNKHREEYYETTQDSTYVSVQAPPYELMEDKAKGIKYAVLQQGSVIASNLNGWQAVSPELFMKLSGGIEVKAPEEDKVYHNVREFLHPKIEASEAHPERKMTTLSSNVMVPKELNGWVAIDKDTFEKLAKDFLTK